VTLPPELLAELRERLGDVARVEPLGGGCISRAHGIEVGGERLFLKYERTAPDGFFAVEAAGLEQLRAAASDIRVPRVRAYRDSPSGWGWLALEWLEPTQPRPRFWTMLGMGLALLHRHACGAATWGWHQDGFIGRLPQSNKSAIGWADFWYQERILPQLRLARAAPGIGSMRDWDRLGGRMPDLLSVAEADGPSLLHGDLWSGNVVATATGPALVDPSCYRGHREVDLAIAALFGGFAPEFFAAYSETWPLATGYEVRRAVYQLYYLLVHVNLFGAGYAPRTALTLARALSW
jgi:protein-ribulosamine 3-kinase